MKQQIKAIVLAAGKGTRMKSDLAKVLHEVCGKPMIGHVLDMVGKTEVNEVYLVIGHQADKVREITKNYKNIVYVEQTEQLGTGHAVMVVEPTLKNYDGYTLILCGDVPLLRAETVNKLEESCIKQNLDGVILTVKLADPKHYGRIIRGTDGLVKKIVEFKDATEEEKKVNEINSGIYCYKTKELFAAIKQVKNHNNQKEYYLTDVIEILVSQGKRIGTVVTEDWLQVHGVNDVNDLKAAEEALLKV